MTLPPASNWPVDYPLFIAHKSLRDPYHILNSIHGPRIVASWGANAWDGDSCVDADDVQRLTHWPAPLRHGFRDPRGVIKRGAKIGDLSSAAVRRLRARTDGVDYWISRVVHVADLAERRYDVILCTEIKTWSKGSLEKLATSVQYGTSIIVMAQPKQVDALRFAHSIGLPTLLLARGVVPPEWAPFLDAVKGSPATCVHMPPRVIRLGTNPRNATIHGCGVTKGNVARAKRAVARLRGAR
jgi:hypothetical protein